MWAENSAWERPWLTEATGELKGAAVVTSGKFSPSLLRQPGHCPGRRLSPGRVSAVTVMRDQETQGHSLPSETGASPQLRVSSSPGLSPSPRAEGGAARGPCNCARQRLLPELQGSVVPLHAGALQVGFVMPCLISLLPLSWGDERCHVHQVHVFRSSFRVM